VSAQSKAREARLLPAGVPRYVHVYDNGGATADRYTVVFTGRYREKTGGEFWYLGMSGAPFHPQGVGMHGSSPRQVDYPTHSHLGRRIKWADLPADCQACALRTYVDLWDLS
jgi:hypothetical protein